MSSSEKDVEQFGLFERLAGLLAIGLAGALVLFALWQFGVPWRTLAVVGVTTGAYGPYIVLFAYLFVNWLYSLRETALVVLDTEHETLRVKKFQPETWASLEKRDLETRDGKLGQVYLAEELTTESTEEVDSETGEEETVGQRVAKGTWAGGLGPYEWLEEKEKYTEHRATTEEYLSRAIKVVGQADSVVSTNTAKTAWSMMRGLEEDEHPDMEGMDWAFDLDEDLAGLEQDDQDDDGDRVAPDHAPLETQPVAFPVGQPTENGTGEASADD